MAGIDFAPKLGFGLMRLPHVGGDMEAPIDIELAKEMVDIFMEAGYTYYDTAYVYEGSEEAARQILVERYPRESFVFATKMPAHAVGDFALMEEVFAEQLERTGLGYFDYYLFHGIDPTNIERFADDAVWQWMVAKKEAGLIKHIGFSFHDHAVVLESLLSAHPEVEMVQFQANYADWDDPVVEARSCYEICRAHGKQIVIMEPLRGGKLCNLPESVGQILAECRPDAPQASWGLRFLGELDGVLAILSGMTLPEHASGNVAIMKGEYGGVLDERERAALAEAQAAIAAIPHIRCTDCRYCVPGCPVGIRIPKIFDAMNAYLVYNDFGSAKFSYGFATRGRAKASECVKCGQCNDICTQHIDVMAELERVVEVLED